MIDRIYCQHGRRIDSCDSCDVIEAEAEIKKIKQQRDQLLATLRSLEVAANTVVYCYEKPVAQGRLAESMARLKESAIEARAAIAAAQQPEEK
jgi:hypothetical protein